MVLFRVGSVRGDGSGREDVREDEMAEDEVGSFGDVVQRFSVRCDPAGAYRRSGYALFMLRSAKFGTQGKEEEFRKNV